MEQYLISRDGVELSRHDSYLEAVGQLHRIQGQSADWACTHEGYAITEAPDAVELKGYLYTLEADLEVEIDLHGAGTQLARDLRDLIASTQVELDNQIYIC